MRILLVGINFYPELTGIGKYSAEMAAYLSHSGHQIRVVTAPPYYPTWYILDDFKGWVYSKDSWEGITIYRCPLWVPKKPTGLKRLIHLLSFAISSIPAIFFQWRWKPEVVISIAPALFSVPFSLLFARLVGARSWLHIQDFELDAASSLGIINAGSVFLRFAQSLESFLFRKFDRVSTISECMQQRLLQKGVSPERTCLFPNWVDTELIHPITGTNSLREELSISGDDVVVLYSGNMGKKQGLDILVSTAILLSECKDIKFVLCGDGAVRADLENQCKHLTNVIFLPLQPVERLNMLLNMADIHVLPQRADAADLVMPSKLTGMLASGKPVIATALPGTEVAQVLKDIGYVVPPGDPQLLTSAILNLAQNRNLRIKLGKRGLSFAESYFNINTVLGGFSQQLERLVF
jgi:colanic acid biosynthesis glycosyl transferase WcaI